MKRSSVLYGLKLVIAAIVMVIAATFFHEEIAAVLFMTPSAEVRFVFLGLFLGGICGCLGILITVTGLLRDPAERRSIRLAPTLIILAATILLFFFLLYSSFRTPEPPRLGPGETITI